MRAPATPGTYRFYIRPLIEGAQWMEDYGIFWQITVPDTVPPSISRAITANASTVLVSFSEDMKCSTDGSTGSIATGTNYTVATSAGSAVAETITATPNPSCTQASLALSDPLSVGAQYTLTASNVQDAAGNTITDAGRSATFTVVVGEIYGLITRRAPDLIVRSENDPRSLGTVPSFVLDSEHRRVAFWVTIGGVSELHMRDVLGGNDRVVGRLPEGLQTGGIVWASDDGGFIVTASSQSETLGPTSFLFTIDSTGGTFRERYRRPLNGPVLIPLGWQRTSDLAAAFETGPGGYNFGYTVVRGSAAAQRYDTPFEITGMEMSPDGNHVVGNWLFEDAVKVWPTDDFDSKTTLASPSNKIATAHWWPRSSEIVYMIGAYDGQFRNKRVERWDPATGRRTIVFTLPDGGSLGGQLVRADGTGVIVPRSGITDTWELHELATGTVTVIQPASEGFLATVMLR